MMKIYHKIQGFSDKNEKTLLFMDDVTAQLKASKIIIETLKKMIYNRRHLKLAIIITSQSYINIPSDVRKNISNIVIFKPSKREFSVLFDELLQSKKTIYEKIMHYVYDNKHNFMTCNIESQRLYKNFDEIIIHNDDSDDEIEIKEIMGENKK